MTDTSLTIGVDIGGTKIAAGVVDAHGALLERTSRLTDPEVPSAIEASVIDCIRDLRTRYDVEAIGVAAAGFISPDRTHVLFAPNIAWRDHPLAERISREVDLPVVVENDANAAAWAEYRFGAGRGTDDMVMITLGTGLGGAVIAGGHLVRGGFGAGAELGHVKVQPGGHRCGCGHEGCWEAYASGTALGKAAQAAVVAQPDRATALLAIAEGAPLSGAHVGRAAHEGDPLALALFQQLGHWLGTGLSTITAVVDPGVVVIGGGIAVEERFFLPAARAAYLDSLSGRGYRGTPRFTTAVMGNDAGIVGAAESARETPSSSSTPACTEPSHSTAA